MSRTVYHAIAVARVGEEETDGHGQAGHSLLSAGKTDSRAKKNIPRFLGSGQEGRNKNVLFKGNKLQLLLMSLS